MSETELRKLLAESVRIIKDFYEKQEELEQKIERLKINYDYLARHQRDSPSKSLTRRTFDIPNSTLKVAHDKGCGSCGLCSTAPSKQIGGVQADHSLDSPLSIEDAVRRKEDEMRRKRQDWRVLRDEAREILNIHSEKRLVKPKLTVGQFNPDTGEYET